MDDCHVQLHQKIEKVKEIVYLQIIWKKKTKKIKIKILTDLNTLEASLEKVQVPVLEVQYRYWFRLPGDRTWWHNDTSKRGRYGNGF
jgi:hypothetical protein